jgi:hypothetical protein
MARHYSQGGRSTPSWYYPKFLARNFELSRRRDNLTHAHHIEVASLSDIAFLVGTWEKGKAIVSFLGGVETTPSWRELERQSGRGDDALKKWCELWQNIQFLCDRTPRYGVVGGLSPLAPYHTIA